MRTIEEIQSTLKVYKEMKQNAEQCMSESLIRHAEFAYNVHLADFKKFSAYVEMLEYVLGERE